MKIRPTLRISAARRSRRAKPLAITLALVLALSGLMPASGAADHTYTYLALGDSIPFGAFAPFGKGYVPLYAKAVIRDTGVWVNTVNLSVPGWTSRDLLFAVTSRPLFRLTAFSSNIITFSIGGNELAAARQLYKDGTCGGPDNEDCMRAAVAALESNWNGILGALAALRHNRPTIMRTTDIYNPFVNVDKASDSWPVGGDGISDFDELKPYLDEVNAYIAAASASNGVRVAPVYQAFNGVAGDEDPGDKGLTAFDDFHPSGLGHAVIASLLRGLGYATVTP